VGPLKVQVRRATGSGEIGGSGEQRGGAWAPLTGVTVRDRGRVPASVVNAYREAHNQ